MNRRTWLGLCVGVLSSGCLGVTAPSRTKIAWIRLENDRDEAREVEVFLERGDEEVFRETYRLGTSSEQSTVHVDAPVDEPGRYSLYVDLGDQLVHLHSSEIADVETGEPCIGITYTLHEEGTTGFEFEPVPEC